MQRIELNISNNTVTQMTYGAEKLHINYKYNLTSALTGTHKNLTKKITKRNHLSENTHNKLRKSVIYFESLKYKIKAMAITRTATMEPTIHLFLLILLDMAVKTLLLLPMLSSTP